MTSPITDHAANRAVQSLLDQLVADGREIGVQVAAYLGDELMVDCWSGHAAPGGDPVTADTLFNVFSVSKALTATAVHIQAENGRLDYDAPIARYWPEFAAAGKEKLTVAQVLTHCSGLMQLPADVTAEQMCDWDWMVSWLAAQPPLFEPGTQSGYQSMSFGWILGELVRRTDARRRPFGSFVREEILLPLGAPDFWLGLPAAQAHRVATLDDSAVQVAADGTLYRVTCPMQVDLMPEPFSRTAVQQACIPAVGGISNARSQAKLFAMLANGGEFQGQRLLSADRVAWFSTPRPDFGPDPVFFGMQVPIGLGGYWLGGDNPPISAPRNPRAICHPGMGGSLGWADPDRRLAVAFCHNRMFDAYTPDQDSRTLVGDAIRAALGLS